MDTLDAELRPLTRLHDAGLGFVVEHVQFLEEPLDALRGNPGAASTEATFWRYCVADVTNVQQELSAVLGALGDGHSGAAATGFGDASDLIDDALHELRLAASNINQRINVVTDLVTHTRSMLGQWVEGYVDDIITEFTAARAASPITQGGSVATTIASAVADASELGNKMGRTLSQLLDRLDEHAMAIREGVAEFAANVERLRSPAPGPGTAVGQVSVAAASAPSPAPAVQPEHGLVVDPDALFAIGQGIDD
ncbi:hypothetical protein FZI91_18320 [Mycobacterium sp. CBMA271]|uniref:hypothetical protein n=1 Tax=unclassified Mycobacteroides TaxID=2618759 RepID=UPI001322CE2F|nr:MULTISPECIES: hypothetical protein [unclassified Mycobacteroides]MUM18369.1 hypothetical protein [Mycobacteroides sp. CBMA 326]MUM23639.1 hypothetical protein [Mycobacteroides sp. CBMA 271]